MIFIIGHWNSLGFCYIWRISLIFKCRKLICFSWWWRIISIRGSWIRKRRTTILRTVIINKLLNHQNNYRTPHIRTNSNNFGHLSKVYKITFVSHKTQTQKIISQLTTSNITMTRKKYLSNTRSIGSTENILKLTPKKISNPHLLLWKRLLTYYKNQIKVPEILKLYKPFIDC